MIKVLIVEDDPMVAEINKKYIEKIKDFEVVGVAKDGEEGYRLIMDKAPDLLILDIYMPRISGLELLKRVRSEGKLIDAIMITAAKESAEINEVLKLGAVDYLVKPFEFSRLKVSLEGYRERRLNLIGKDSLTQEDIDALTLGNRMLNKNLNVEMEKGIQRKTMELIKGFLSKETTAKSATEVAEGLGISRVTARRYLEHLLETGEVELDISYGTIGRPVNLYFMRK